MLEHEALKKCGTSICDLKRNCCGQTISCLNINRAEMIESVQKGGKKEETIYSDLCINSAEGGTNSCCSRVLGPVLMMDISQCPIAVQGALLLKDKAGVFLYCQLIL